MSHEKFHIVKKEINICCGYNKPNGISGILHRSIYKDYYKCQYRASIFEEDKWWCKKHAPTKIKEREEKNWKNYISKIRKNVERNS